MGGKSKQYNPGEQPMTFQQKYAAIGLCKSKAVTEPRRVFGHHFVIFQPRRYLSEGPTAQLQCVVLECDSLHQSSPCQQVTKHLVRKYPRQQDIDIGFNKVTHEGVQDIFWRLEVQSLTMQLPQKYTWCTGKLSLGILVARYGTRNAIPRWMRMQVSQRICWECIVPGMDSAHEYLFSC